MKTSLWLNVDPLAEKYFMNSPYIYVSQKPMNLIDPTGMGEEDPIDPPKPGTGTSTGNMQGHLANGAPNGVDLPAEQLNEVVVNGKSKKSESSINSADGVTLATAVTVTTQELQYSKHFESWKGINGKMYSGLKGSGPNQFTGSRGLAMSKSANIGYFGLFLGGVSVGLTEYNYANSLKIPYGPNMREYLSKVRARDQIANASGFMGVIGAAASFGYNLGYLIEHTCNCNIQYNPITNDFTPIEQTYMEYDRLGINLFKN